MAWISTAMTRAIARRKKILGGSIIALTGYGRRKIAKRSPSLDFNINLTKPVGLAGYRRPFPSYNYIYDLRILPVAFFYLHVSGEGNSGLCRKRVLVILKGLLGSAKMEPRPEGEPVESHSEKI